MPDSLSGAIHIEIRYRTAESHTGDKERAKFTPRAMHGARAYLTSAGTSMRAPLAPLGLALLLAVVVSDDLSGQIQGPQAANPNSNANVELCGVNSGWIDPLGLLLQVNRDKQGRAGSWLPPNVEGWVNKSDPFNSASLNDLMAGLQLGNYRYPGGSIGNSWDWKANTMSPLANDSFHTTIAKVLATGVFPPAALGVARFDAMAQRAGAKNILALDVSTAGPDPSIPALVVKEIGLERASRFEIGNEVYDPTQGPQPGGYSTAQEYLADTAALVKAVRDVGATAGVNVGPCPFFYPEGSPCWGGPDGRYHQWNRNISNACQATSGGACPFDAVIAHNYVTDVTVIQPYAKQGEDVMLSVFLTVPQVTIDFGAATMERDFADGIRLWITEYNTMFAQNWGGKADETAPEAAAFLNRCVGYVP